MAIPIDPHLPPITPPAPPRVAEPTDARLPIREHEEQAKRKKEEDEKKETILPEDSYDQSVLAVRPLIDFLKNFLHGRDMSLVQPKQSATDNASGTMPAHHNPAAGLPTETSAQFFVSGASARAASAYRHSAEAGQVGGSSGAHPIPSPSIGSVPGAPVDLLQNAEIRQIHEVIKMLEELEKRGVPGIRLERAETFVTAIENAARQELVNTR